MSTSSRTRANPTGLRVSVRAPPTSHLVSEPLKDGAAGLGLALVARAVEQLGGELRVDSNIGAGSRFSILLPLLHSKNGAYGQAPRLGRTPAAARVTPLRVSSAVAPAAWGAENVFGGAFDSNAAREATRHRAVGGLGKHSSLAS